MKPVIVFIVFVAVADRDRWIDSLAKAKGLNYVYRNNIQLEINIKLQLKLILI